MFIRRAAVGVCLPDIECPGSDRDDGVCPFWARGHDLYDLVAVHVALVWVDDHRPEVLEVEGAPDAIWHINNIEREIAYIER